VEIIDPHIINVSGRRLTMDRRRKNSRLISTAVVLSVEWRSSVTSLLDTQKG